MPQTPPSGAVAPENGPPGAATLDEAGLRRVLDSSVDHAVVATDAARRITLWSEGARHTAGTRTGTC